MWPRPVLAVALLVTLASPSFATPVDVRPISDSQIQTYGNGVAGGSFNCTTRGQYIASTQSLTQTGSCSNSGETGVRLRRSVLDPAGLFIEGWDATLAGFVDNHGNVIDGNFSLFGAIPEAGINDTSLLASGRLLEVYYGPVGSGDALEMLIDLTSVVSPLQSFGPLFYWRGFVESGSWQGEACPRELGCAPWRVDASDFQNFTGTEYRFLSRAAIVPGPNALSLLILGLAILLTTRRRYSTRPDRQAARIQA